MHVLGSDAGVLGRTLGQFWEPIWFVCPAMSSDCPTPSCTVVFQAGALTALQDDTWQIDGRAWQGLTQFLQSVGALLGTQWALLASCPVRLPNALSDPQFPAAGVSLRARVTR